MMRHVLNSSHKNKFWSGSGLVHPAGRAAGVRNCAAKRALGEKIWLRQGTQANHSFIGANSSRCVRLDSGRPSLARQPMERNPSLSDEIHGCAGCGIALGSRSASLHILARVQRKQPHLPPNSRKLTHPRVMAYWLSVKGSHPKCPASVFVCLDKLPP
jgi:hypothetical protein